MSHYYSKIRNLFLDPLPLDLRAPLYVADKEPLDYGSGAGRREETPAWSNNGYYLDRKSFPKDMRPAVGTVHSSGNELHHRLRLESK